VPGTERSGAAAEPITDVDGTAADVLFELDRGLDGRGQALAFSELKDPVRRKIDRYGLAREIEHFFPTVEAAVDAWTAMAGTTGTDPAGGALPGTAAVVPPPRPGAPGSSSAAEPAP